MRNKKKFVTSLLCGMSCFMLAAVPVMADADIQKYTNTDFAMDTVVSETLYTTGKDLNATVGDKIREIETELQGICSGYKFHFMRFCTSVRVLVFRFFS